jgi:integrase
MRTLLEAAGAICHPMFPVWIVALHTGMRSGELFALEWADIDFEGKLIHVTKSYDRKFKQIGPTKGRAWRDVALSEELERYLRELQATSHGRTHVLPRVAAWERGEQARETRIMCRIAEVPSVRFHALRACWTTELLRQGVPAAKVMRMGGWASFSRMEIYARLAGIEIRGATDGLKLIPEARIAKVHHLAGVAVKASPCNIRS